MERFYSIVPKRCSKADCTLHHRLIEDLKHFGTDIEGPKLPQEEQCVLSLLGDSLSVGFQIVYWPGKLTGICSCYSP